MEKQKQQSDMQAALAERKRKEEVSEMISNAHEAMNAAEKQKEYHYAQMMDFRNKKDYKRAERHAKMYIFMDKLSTVCKEYAGMIEDQKAMAEMFSVMQKMNKNFNALMTVTDSSMVTAKSLKNLKKFRKSISDFDSQLDSMLGAMDEMFEEPKKKSFFGFGKKGKEQEPAAPAQTDEEVLMSLIGSNPDLSAKYESTTGEKPTVDTHTFGTGAGAGFTGTAPAASSSGSGQSGPDVPFTGVGLPD